MIGTPNRQQAWLNFAQRSREEGGLGLAPHQAAGLVGNLIHESGQDLNPWGPTGDNGTAWGTAQWRGDRLARLKALPNYQTMEGQQAHMRSEMDGPEAKAYAALQKAQTPEEAATIVNTLYERSADRTGGRERAARDLMSQFGGGGAPEEGPAPALAFASTDTGSKKMAGPALSPDEMQGPGALSQQSDGTPGIFGYAMSQNTYEALKGISAAMADDPERAKAIYAQVAASRKAQTDNGTWSIHTDKNGNSYYFNNKYPRVIPRGNVDKEEPEKVDASILKDLNGDWGEKYGGLHYAAGRAKEFKDLIDSGKLDLSIAARGQAYWDSLWGKASPQARLYNDFESWRTQLANDSLRLNAGVQTEGDAKRAKEELATSFGQYDAPTVSKSLHNFIERTGRVMQDSARNQLDSYSGNYKNKEPFAPYYKKLEEQQKFYDDYGKATPSPAPAAPGKRPPLSSIFGKK